MAHLVSPISIGGTLYCPVHGKPAHTIGRAWRTQSILSGGAGFLIGEDNDGWLVADSGNDATRSPTNIKTYVGSVTFGTSCLKSLALCLFIDRDSFADIITVRLYVNEVLYDFAFSGSAVLVYNQTNSTAGDPYVSSHLPQGAMVSRIVAPMGPHDVDRSVPRLLIDLEDAELIDRPCGNVFRIEAELNIAAPTRNYVQCQILDVT